MAIAALVAWSITALGGGRMFVLWVTKGGAREPDNSRLRPQLVYGHLLLGLAGLGIWILYLNVDFQNLAWIDFILLLVQASVGLTMYSLWRPVADASWANLAAENVQEVWPPEKHFPVWLVRGHGVVAAITTILVLLTAIGVGGV